MPVFDSTTPMFLVKPDAKPPDDPATGKPLANVRERIDRLILEMESKSQIIVIPTPALAEALVVSGRGKMEEWIAMLDQSPYFHIAEFDVGAVKKLVHVTRAIHGSKTFEPDPQFTRAQLKFDRQIVAIALARNQRTIYSDDKGIKRLERYFDIEGIPTPALPAA